MDAMMARWPTDSSISNRRPPRSSSSSAREASSVRSRCSPRSQKRQGPRSKCWARWPRVRGEVGALVVHLTYVPVAGNRSSNRKPPLFAAINDNMDTWEPDQAATTVVPEIGVDRGGPRARAPPGPLPDVRHRDVQDPPEPRAHDAADRGRVDQYRHPDGRDRGGGRRILGGHRAATRRSARRRSTTSRCCGTRCRSSPP